MKERPVWIGVGQHWLIGKPLHDLTEGTLTLGTPWRTEGFGGTSYPTKALRVAFGPPLPGWLPHLVAPSEMVQRPGDGRIIPHKFLIKASEPPRIT